MFIASKSVKSDETDEEKCDVAVENIRSETVLPYREISEFRHSDRPDETL